MDYFALIRELTVTEQHCHCKCHYVQCDTMKPLG